ncbi:hypothetical protein [Streptomyces meridianus]|uniref:Uncharacterized protein n=1 Tax=Streptomyces meridianus TaxID=2938945 RepID=A0ABT0XBY1_9ACTN|nr:hypothetical protein [Streptomyces meridianus]MCM2579304.1 hypothetical protein [Streptomyces meridianus]
MTARPEERSEFDPVAEHGSSPEKPLLRSDEHVGEPAAKPSGKQSGGLLDKLGKHVGMGAGSHPGKSVNRRTDEGVDKRPDERTLREESRERHTRETGPVPSGEPGAPARPGSHAGAAGQPGRDAERMAPEQPPADPRDEHRGADRHTGSQPVDAGHALAERMAGTTRDGTLPAQRTSPPGGDGHPGHAPHHGHEGSAPPQDPPAGGDRDFGADARHAHRPHGADDVPGTAPVLADRAGAAEKRLHEAVTGFVDDPRSSVEAADALLEEIATVFTEALAERRRALRDGWHGGSEVTDTEDLRSSLRGYRDLVARLLHV